jgi:DNA polymerase-3 subunit gamma/tau
VVTALYRRYRPETFAELIGQSQVTDPLRTALRTDRVNHAYLFSGPRGCGKTTSARILARCLNCVEGPTDTPCGKCDSCVELSRDGGGSLDVVEIDAASHNGVDDARDLRERAVFAPARDRFKIFILDEAHMVTPQGFNALLKIVEEPPEHVKFIFATTEPEKVIGTIRSRTHHYPFRLVPPAQMLEYVGTLCEAEGVTVEPGVLPLVVRAGGGSVRDTLSLLDQLIAGSEGTNVEYERAVALLGYTHGALLDEIVDSLGAHDSGAVFSAVDRVIQTGQDPRRFVEDLLERLRDLIIVAATADRASAVLRGIPQDQLERMSKQAAVFGQAELSRGADVVNAALTEMTGATSPRLHLELMVARILVPASDASERGALARVERLERRVGVAALVVEPAAPVVEPAAPVVEPAETPIAKPVSTGSTAGTQIIVEEAIVEEVKSGALTPPAVEPVQVPDPVPEITPATPVTLQQMRDSWPEVLEAVRATKLNAWVVLQTAEARNLVDDVLTVTFVSENDVANFKQPHPSGDSVSEYLRKAIVEVLGLRVKFIAKVEARPEPEVEPAETAPEDTEPVSSSATVSTVSTSSTTEATEDAEPVSTSSTTEDGWAVAAIPESEPAQAPRKRAEPVAKAEPTDKRYGESVVREMLGASFIEEQPLKPRVVPTARDE